MKQQLYTNAIAQLTEEYNALNIYNDDTRTRQLHIVSANLHHCLPQLDYDRHETIFRNILLHQKLSMTEQDSMYALDNAVIENFSSETLQSLKQMPAIICTFHLGSYRLINLLLTKHHVPFSLVIAKKVVNMQGSTFKSLHKRVSGKNGSPSFNLINAETPTAALQMFRELKRGNSLVIYLDGNTGAGINSKENENCCAVNFLHQQLMARTGAGFLSHAADVPILPVISYRTSLEKIAIRFFDMIYPNKKEDRSCFARSVTQQLYSLAAPFIQQYPDQWESWLYLHKVIKIIKPLKVNMDAACPRPAGKLLFNSTYFGLFKMAEQGYLFDKSSYMSYPMPDDIYALLQRAVSNPIDKYSFSVNLRSECFQRKILITA